MRHTVILEHLDDFLRAAAHRADGAGLPEFIARKFREFLTRGVLAPHAQWRAEVVAYRRADSGRAPGPSAAAAEAGRGRAGSPRCWTWALLMRRAFDLDVLRCPRCAGRMQLIATIDDPAVIQEILAHLGYAEFQGPALGWVVVGNAIITSSYLLTGSPLAAILSHVAMHVAAVLHGMETMLQLPPHY